MDTTTTAALLRDAGMQTVRDHQADNWKAAYVYAVAQWFEKLAPGEEFIGEQIRQAVQPVIGPPTHANAWGAMAGSTLRRWARERRIELIGVRRATGMTSHARLYPLYRRL